MNKYLIIFLIASCNAIFSQNNLISSKYSAEEIKKILVPQNGFKPFPKISDREAWSKLNSLEMKMIVKQAEADLKFNFQGIPATVTLLFQRTGDRQEYENLSFSKRVVLSNLLLAELYENKGRFVDQIVNGVWSICEESYWGVPAHLNQWHAGAGLPDVTDPYVDLFTTETSALLAWVDYFLGEKLDAISPQLRKRIYTETEKRIFIPAMTANHPWMGFVKKGRRPNNWNPWISSNWLNTALLIEKDEDKRAKMVTKILLILDQYLNPYPQDGGCDEGPHYWGVAHASLFDNIELLNLASNNAFNFVYQDEKIRNMGRFIYKAQISPAYFVNFADAPPKASVPSDLAYRYGRAIGDQKMMEFGAYYQKDSLSIDRVFVRTLFELFNHDELAKTPKQLPLLKDAWYPDIQVMMARDKEGSTDGFYVAAKGGNNDESHNHNDVGNFVVYYNGLPLLMDVGKGTYTARTFSPKRYEIWSNSSDFHNLPTINGKNQMPGPQFKAGDVNYTKESSFSQLSLNIANAYPQDAEVKSWMRSIRLNRNKEVRITDEVQLSNAQSVCQHFMTCYPVENKRAGELLIHFPNKNLIIKYDFNLFEVNVEKVKMTAPEDEGVLISWGDAIYRINFNMKNPKLSFKANYSIITN